MSIIKAKISGIYPNYVAEVREKTQFLCDTVTSYPIVDDDDIAFLKMIDFDFLEVDGWVKFKVIKLPKKSGLKTEAQGYTRELSFKILHNQQKINSGNCNISEPSQPDESTPPEKVYSEEERDRFAINFGTWLIGRHIVDIDLENYKVYLEETS